MVYCFDVGLLIDRVLPLRLSFRGNAKAIFTEGKDHVERQSVVLRH